MYKDNCKNFINEFHNGINNTSPSKEQYEYDDIEIKVIVDCEIENRVWKVDYIYAIDKENQKPLGYFKLSYVTESMVIKNLPTPFHHFIIILGHYRYNGVNIKNILDKLNNKIELTDIEIQTYYQINKDNKKNYNDFISFFLNYGYCDFIRVGQNLKNKNIGTLLYYYAIDHCLNKGLNFKFTTLIQDENKSFREKILTSGKYKLHEIGGGNDKRIIIKTNIMKIKKTINRIPYTFYITLIPKTKKVLVRYFQSDEGYMCDLSDDFKYILLPENIFNFEGKEVKKLKLSKNQMYDVIEYVDA